MNEYEYDIAALHYIYNNTNQSMMQLGKFLGDCSTLPWYMYGIHITAYKDHLIFIG